MFVHLPVPLPKTVNRVSRLLLPISGIFDSVQIQIDSITVPDSIGRAFLQIPIQLTITLIMVDAWKHFVRRFVGKVRALSGYRLPCGQLGRGERVLAFTFLTRRSRLLRVQCLSAVFGIRLLFLLLFS